MRIVGLMSGTSADGVDAALVEWEADEAARPFRLLAFGETPYPPVLQQQIHRLAAGRAVSAGGEPSDSVRELAALDVGLGERFAEAAIALVERAGVAIDSIDGIASHGQTVGHYPDLRATLQLGDPSLIAERTGCTTIADFRPRDIAAGGEGAPLAPFFHHAALSDPDENRLVVNLGGIANITWLPAGGDPDAVIAFDVGPANSLIDGVVRFASGDRERIDRDGVRALRGRVDDALLERLLDDEFLRRAPPKSTGRERYGLAEAEQLVADSRGRGRDLDDLVATLVAFTTEAIARACGDFLPRKVDRVFVGGGGVRNPAVMRSLQRGLPHASVDPMDVAGVPADAAEAMAFALMGRNALLGIPNHLPRCTGARHATVLGEISPGRKRIELRDKG